MRYVPLFWTQGKAYLHFFLKIIEPQNGGKWLEKSGIDARWCGMGNLRTESSIMSTRIDALPCICLTGFEFLG